MSDNRGIFDKKKLLSGRPEGIHKGSAGARRSDDVDIDGIIEKSGCSVTYFALEECMGEHDRDWRKCQEAVKALRSCSQAQAQAQRQDKDKPTK